MLFDFNCFILKLFFPNFFFNNSVDEDSTLWETVGWLSESGDKSGLISTIGSLTCILDLTLGVFLDFNTLNIKTDSIPLLSVR